MKFVIIFAVLIAVASARLIYPFGLNYPNDFRAVSDSLMENNSGDMKSDEGLLESNNLKFNMCKICIKIAEIVEKAQHFNTSDIKRIVDLFCDVIMLPYCRRIADLSIDTIIALIRNGKGAVEACQSMNHCPKYEFYY